MASFIDLTGRKFGRLTVIERAPKRKGHTGIFWRCLCDCGNEKIVYSGALKNGSTVSCKCYHREYSSRNFIERNVTHGMTDSLEYRCWQGMHDRCSNPNSPAYKNYGGRGISVASAWNEFAAFYADMGPRPSLDHSIDRINTNGNYEKSNCRWATDIEQANNKRNTRIVTFLGETQCISQAIKRSGLKYSTVFARINTYGWSIEEALNTPIWKRPRSH